MKTIKAFLLLNMVMSSAALASSWRVTLVNGFNARIAKVENADARVVLSVQVRQAAEDVYRILSTPNSMGFSFETYDYLVSVNHPLGSAILQTPSGERVHLNCVAAEENIVCK